MADSRDQQGKDRPDVQKKEVVVERGGGPGVWIAVIVVVLLVAVLLFIWPGWLMASDSGDPDVINIEEEQPSNGDSEQEQDIDVDLGGDGESSDETTQ